MMTKRAGILVLLIIFMAVFWMRPEKRVGRNADASSFILSAHAQTANYGGATTVGSFSANCIPVAPTATTLNCSALSDNATNVTSTEVFLAPDGGYAFSGLTTMNINRSGNTLLVGASNMAISTASHYVGIRNDGTYGWSVNTNPDTAGDLILGRRTTATLRMGAADVNGTPVAQTISVQGAITGTDLPGKQFSLAGSLGTGAALPLPVVIQGADASVASGATAQTEINRFVSADTKNLTSGAAATLLSIPLATLQTTGGLVFIHMEATDGTNQCTLDDLVTYAAENSAGVFVVNTSKMGTGATACTATKSLTATYAVTSANPALLQVTPTLTGITATRFTAVYTVMHGGMTNPTL